MGKKTRPIIRKVVRANHLQGFLDAVFPADIEGFIELRALPGGIQAFFRPREIRSIRQFVSEHANKNVYFGLATRQERGDGSLTNCAKLSALWVDLDFKTLPEPEARERVEAFLLPPTIIVASGGGLHMYWLLETAVDVQTEKTRLYSVLRRLATYLGGDRAAAEPARILRIPGTRNYKYDPPRQVTIERVRDSCLYSLSKIEQALPEEPEGKARGTRFTVPDTIEYGERNTTLYRLGRSLKARGLSTPAIRAALLEENEARCEPPLSEEEVEEIATHSTMQADRADFGRASPQQARRERLTAHSIQEPWPTLAPEALTGLAGEIVGAIDPYTEADRVALLIHSIVALGNVVGDSPHFRVESTIHPCRLFIGLVGETAKARKGTAWSTPRALFRRVDPDWVDRCVTSGLSSGEGVIFTVRDLRKETQPIRKGGRVVDYQEVIVDPGAKDKRLLVVEEEAAQPLKVMNREGNILSPILRQAWDSGDLHPLTKHNPIRATRAHISVIGHITREELLRHLNETEQANGFANRFIWLLVRRSKVIPRPTGTPKRVLLPLINKLREAVDVAKEVDELERSDPAEALWEKVYPALSEGKPGLLGAILARAEVQVMRLACIYALLDCSKQIEVTHLKAALALWEYSEASARRIFGTRLGNPVADRILGALQARGELTETEIHSLFRRHKSGEEIAQALDYLQSLGLVIPEGQETGGRPRTIWRAENYAEKSD